jgi:hypothetical protein
MEKIILSKKEKYGRQKKLIRIWGTAFEIK